MDLGFPCIMFHVTIYTQLAVSLITSAMAKVSLSLIPPRIESLARNFFVQTGESVGANISY